MLVMWLIWPVRRCYYIGDSDVEECGHPWPPPITSQDNGGDLGHYSHRK